MACINHVYVYYVQLRLMMQYSILLMTSILNVWILILTLHAMHTNSTFLHAKYPCRLVVLQLLTGDDVYKVMNNIGNMRTKGANVKIVPQVHYVS